MTTTRDPLWQKTEDIGLSVFLGLLALYLPFLVAGNHASFKDSPWLSLLQTALFLSAAFTAVHHPLARVLAIGLSLTAVCGHWTAMVFDGRGFDTFRLISAMVLFGMITISLSRQTFRPGRITGHRVRGAMAVYLLMGLVWALAYALLDLYVPGSFDIERASAESRFQDLVYFSYVTLTTVGYGDMAPLSAQARSLAIVEAIAGQMYLAVVLARLVSLELSQRDDAQQSAD